jgi:hypothetical protein
LADDGALREPLSGLPHADDPFVARFFHRIPPSIARSFTPQQLAAVKLAFGTRQWGDHPIDLRRTFGIGRWRFYIVLLMGRARRGKDIRKQGLVLRILSGGLERLIDQGTIARRFAGALILSLFVVTLAAAGMATLYAGKRYLGVDIFPGIDMVNDDAVERALD